ncbi:MAG: hypothetical protein GY913_13070 [Proteobacteria bacterium]|nr:hypothetical protein [Pseudomonadota bacterium]
MDQDCDGYEVCYQDYDDDGYTDGSTTMISSDEDCSDAGEGTSSDPVDDCDGETDPADSVDAATWYADGDGDGYGDPDVTELACEQPSGCVSDDADCDDSDAQSYPGATELEGDGIDQDCDGSDALDDDKDGCGGCSQGSSGGSGFSLLALGLLGLLRRRAD